MTRIKCGNFTVEIHFANYSKGIVDYHFRFFYKDKSILNPAISKNDLIIVKTKGNDLMQFLEDVLRFDKKRTWESQSDGFFFCIAPFITPGLEDRENSENMSLATKKMYKEIAKFRKNGGKYPSDDYLLEFRFDINEFEKLSRSTTPHFMGMDFMLKRYQLQGVLDKLKMEYRIFCKKFKIDDPREELEKILNGAQRKKVSALEKQFEKAMFDIHKQANEKLGYKGDSLIAFIGEHGGLGAAKLILRGPDFSRWALKVKKLKRIEDFEFSVESLVVKPKWAKLFTRKEIKIAKERLDQWKIK